MGVQTYVYDVFGPAVNLAARMQTYANPMKIVCPAEMKVELIDGFQLDDIGRYEIKGMGEMDLCTVTPNLFMARR